MQAAWEKQGKTLLAGTVQFKTTGSDEAEKPRLQLCKASRGGVNGPWEAFEAHESGLENVMGRLLRGQFSICQYPGWKKSW